MDYFRSEMLRNVQKLQKTSNALDVKVMFELLLTNENHYYLVYLYSRFDNMTNKSGDALNENHPYIKTN